MTISASQPQGHYSEHMTIVISLLAGHHYLIHIYHNEKCYNHQGEAPHSERLRTSEFD